MPVPNSMTDLSATPASNSPAGSDAVTINTGPDEYIRALSAIVRRLAAADTIASAATTDLGTKDQTFLSVSGTTTIVSFGIVPAGIWKVLTFAGALTLTHNGSSMILPGAANIETAAGDAAVVLSLGSGNWRCLLYQRANGAPITLSPDQVGLPNSLTGGALDMLRVKADESGYEHRTPAQVRADIGAEPAGATAAMPVGGIIMWPRATAPAKYLECAGQLVSRTAYPELFDVLGIYYSAGDGSTTFGLPDYRGVFPRGWDHGRGIADVDRHVGVYTPDSLASHDHLVTNSADVWGGGAGGSQGYISNSSNNTIHQSDAAEARRNRTTATGGAETYPKHIIAMFCIRAEP